jgi:hypothetical protein
MPVTPSGVEQSRRVAERGRLRAALPWSCDEHVAGGSLSSECADGREAGRVSERLAGAESRGATRVLLSTVKLRAPGPAAGCGLPGRSRRPYEPGDCATHANASHAMMANPAGAKDGRPPASVSPRCSCGSFIATSWRCCSFARSRRDPGSRWS